MAKKYFSRPKTRVGFATNCWPGRAASKPCLPTLKRIAEPIWTANSAQQAWRDDFGDLTSVELTLLRDRRAFGCGFAGRHLDPFFGAPNVGCDGLFQSHDGGGKRRRHRLGIQLSLILVGWILWGFVHGHLGGLIPALLGVDLLLLSSISWAVRGFEDAWGFRGQIIFLASLLVVIGLAVLIGVP